MADRCVLLEHHGDTPPKDDPDFEGAGSNPPQLRGHQDPGSAPGRLQRSGRRDLGRVRRSRSTRWSTTTMRPTLFNLTTSPELSPKNSG